MSALFRRRTFLAAGASLLAAPHWSLGNQPDANAGGPQLAVVSALGADHPLLLSFVSQLLEQGIWFDTSHDQQVFAQLPEDLPRYRAVVLDAPAAEALLADNALRERLERFARQGGFVFLLESPPRDDGLRPAVNSKLLLDLVTQHRVSDIVAHARLAQHHPGLKQLQQSRPVERMLGELKSALVTKLASKTWSEYTLHNWKAALALIAAGHADLRDRLASTIERACRDIPPPAHHDHVAGYFGAAWLAEQTGNREPLARVTQRLDEMLARRPRTMGVVSGYGYTDDPLRLAEAEATGRAASAFAHTVMRRDTIWTEMLHMHAATMASLARAANRPQYRDELLRLIEHIHRYHLRADGLLAHSTRDGQPIAAAWARGQTHALYGLVYTLDELVDDDPARGSIIELLDRVGQGLLPHQDAATGLWRNVIDLPHARLEGSGTTGITYVYARAVEAGWLPRGRYAPMLRRAWAGLRTLYWRSGLAANCRGTGVGMDESYYLARPQGWAWMPQLILAALAMRKLEAAEANDCSPS